MKSNPGKIKRKLMRLEPDDVLHKGDGFFSNVGDGQYQFLETLSPGNIILDRGYPTYYRPVEE